MTEHHEKSISRTVSAFLLLSLISCDRSTSEDTLSFEISNGVLRVEDGSCYYPLEDGTLSYLFREATEIVVPAEFDGKTVTEIRDSAFSHSKKTLRSITLPDTIRTIGFYAFMGCELLSEINLPESITSIGGQAFAYCTSLKHITISGKLVGYGFFAHSGLETVTLLEGVDKIPSNTFSGTNLKEVILPSSVREIENEVFSDCKSLEKVILNDGLQWIGFRSFSGTCLKEIVIPASVSYITEDTFSKCEKLNHVYFEGNAPKESLYRDSDVDILYTVHYHEGASGFTSPEWCGHPTELW